MRPGFRYLIVCLGILASAVGCRSNPTTVPNPTALPAVPTAAATAVSTATPSAQDLTVASLNAEAGDTVIHLSWQPVPGARGYLIYRDEGSNPLNAAPVTNTRFDDIGLTNGRTYSYAVAAVGQDGKAGPRSALIRVAPKSK